MSQKSGRKAAVTAGEDAKSSEAGSATSPGSDTVLIHGVTEDGQGLAVLRAREDRVEAGVVRPLREGEPVMGELVRLKPRPELPLVCDVEVELPSRIGVTPQPAKLSHGGPAQVATESYRANWDAIWKKPKGSDQPN